jgi:hypothetical protein
MAMGEQWECVSHNFNLVSKVKTFTKADFVFQLAFPLDSQPLCDKPCKDNCTLHTKRDGMTKDKSITLHYYPYPQIEPYTIMSFLGNVD